MVRVSMGEVVVSSNPFDYVTSISHKKNHMIDDDLSEKNYVPFLTNRSLSNFVDTVRIANEMNQRPSLDHKLQYEFLLNIVRPKKRYAKWAKPIQYDDAELVKEYYGYSNRKAAQALTLLSREQLDIIQNKLIKGGVEP